MCCIKTHRFQGQLLTAPYRRYRLYLDAQVTDEVISCEALSLAEAEAGYGGFEPELDKTISFSDKQRIAYGKYGFHRNLVVKEPAAEAAARRHSAQCADTPRLSYDHQGNYCKNLI